MTLVIMAAGMGSRFGGLKQVEPVGPNGEFILDYSVYDAIKAGYNKIVFIIKEENYDLFRETVGKRIENKINVEYVFQKIEEVPSFVNIPKMRVKPWGTSHAILACKDVVKEPFTVINADDFYGFEPFLKVKEFFDNEKGDNEYCMVGYKACNTLTENGSVKRGICEEINGYLSKLTESSIEKVNGTLVATPLDDNLPSFNVSENALVSMNFWGFNTKIFNLLENEMYEFFKNNENNLDKCEFLIPTSVFNYIKENKITVKVLSTNAKWYGVTYKEDKESLVNAINNMIKDGIYPSNLWD